MYMKFYIASRLKHKNEVKKLINLLEDKGYTCTHDWTRGEKLKPYAENLDQSQKLADEQVKSIKNCDLFVLLNPDEGGTGMYVELGVAIAENKQIFVVGEFTKPVFLFHSSVNYVQDIDGLLKEV